VSQAKLTPEQVREARKLHKKGVSQKKIAALFSVPPVSISQASISKLLAGKNYSRVA
jgi:predicted transcriptional regulator